MPWAHHFLEPQSSARREPRPLLNWKTLTPSPLTWGRCDPAPKDFPAASNPEAQRAGGGGPAKPYLSVSPVSRSWGLCDWSAFSPGRSAAWSPPEGRQSESRACSGNPGCRVWRRRRAARSAGARRVRLISIAHHLGQPARSTAGRGREATPRTGAWAGKLPRGRRCQPHGTPLARVMVTHRPRGGWPSTCPG